MQLFSLVLFGNSLLGHSCGVLLQSRTSSFPSVSGGCSMPVMRGAWALALALAIATGGATGEAEAKSRRPNVVLLLADDLGIGDVGCYGNDTIRTPNIDRLSSEGVRLGHHLSASAMCTPSRAALLTARYPARYGLEGEEGTAPVLVHVASRVGLPLEEVTLASALRAANYSTAAVGKWHLGMRCGLLGRGCDGPRTHGFQSFFGLPFTLVEEFEGEHIFWSFPSEPFYKRISRAWLVGVLTVFVWGFLAETSRASKAKMVLLLSLGVSFAWFVRTHYRFHTARWWQVSPWMDQHMNGILMEDERVVEQPVVLEGLSQRLVDYSVKFIEKHAEDDNPFFLYHSFAHVHAPMFTAKHMAGKSAHGRYGDNVEEMDAGVGAILEALSRLGLDETTIVYFISDNGGHLENLGDDGQRIGGHNGAFKGGKGMGGTEGGIRVPGVFRWKGHLPAGKLIETPTSLLDTLPTVLEMAGLPPLNKLLPDKPERDLDGVSLAALLAEGTPLRPRSLIHHCGKDIHAARLVLQNRVYKMHLAKPKWSPGSTQCGWGRHKICSCHGDGVVDLSIEPEIYNLDSDPSEDDPLPNDSTEYYQVSGALRQFLAEWRARVAYPPSQFQSKLHTHLSLFLQPFRLPFGL